MSPLHHTSSVSVIFSGLLFAKKVTSPIIQWKEFKTLSCQIFFFSRMGVMMFWKQINLFLTLSNRTGQRIYLSFVLKVFFYALSNNILQCWGEEGRFQLKFLNWNPAKASFGMGNLFFMRCNFLEGKPLKTIKHVFHGFSLFWTASEIYEMMRDITDSLNMFSKYIIIFF